MNMVGYGRVSTGKEEQLDSLAHQYEFFETFAAAHKHRLMKIYADEGISGKALKNRDAFNQMLWDAEKQEFQLVVVKDISRFARNTVDLLQSVRKLKALGIEVLFVNNGMKILGESEFVLTLMGAIAQEESANLSKRVKFGKNINSKKGRVPPCIFGYDRLDNFTLSINEEEARVVREIYQLYIDAGYGCRKIALALEEQGARTKLGGSWNARGVGRILSNSIYCGRYENHKYAVTDFLDGTCTQLPPEEHYVHARPAWAIVSEARFEAAQRTLALRRQTYAGKSCDTRGRYSSRHLFSTLIRCAECGRAFTRRSVTYVNTYHYWRCPTNNEYTAKRCENATIVREEDLLAQLRGFFSTLIADQDSFAKQVWELCLAQSQKAPVKTVESLQRQCERLERQRTRYLELYANEVIALEAVTAKTAEVDARMAELQKAIREADASACRDTADPVSMGEVVSAIRKFITMDEMENVDLRAFVSLICVTKGGEVQIHLKVTGDRGVA